MKQRVEVVCLECSGSGQRKSDFYNRPCELCRGRRTVVCEVAPEPSAELPGMLVAAVPELLTELRAIREALQSFVLEAAEARKDRRVGWVKRHRDGCDQAPGCACPEGSPESFDPRKP